MIAGPQARLRPAVAFLALAVAAPTFAQEQPTGPITPAEVADRVRQIQPQLPIQVNEEVAFVGLRAEGTELIFAMRMSQTVPAAQFDAFVGIVRATVQSQVCGTPDQAAFVRRGARLRHVFTDPSGRTFETRVVSCP